MLKTSLVITIIIFIIFKDYEEEKYQLPIPKLIMKNSSGEETILSSHVSNFYVSKDKIYYSKTLFDSRSYVIGYAICQYDVRTNNEKILLQNKVDDEISYDFFKGIFENGYIILKKRIRHKDSNNGASYTNECILCKMKVESGEIDEIFDTDNSIFSFNVYDEKIYVCANKGITVVNLETNKKIKLTDDSTENCYILDDKWIYFIDKNSKLWRITNDGKITEKVFG